VPQLHRQVDDRHALGDLDAGVAVAQIVGMKVRDPAATQARAITL
jgi:hypothetical protein